MIAALICLLLITVAGIAGGPPSLPICLRRGPANRSARRSPLRGPARAPDRQAHHINRCSADAQYRQGRGGGMPRHDLLCSVRHMFQFAPGFPPAAPRRRKAGRDHFACTGTEALGLVCKFLDSGAGLSAGIARGFACADAGTIGHILGQASNLAPQGLDPVRDVRAGARIISEHVHLPGWLGGSPFRKGNAFHATRFRPSRAKVPTCAMDMASGPTACPGRNGPCRTDRAGRSRTCRAATPVCPSRTPDIFRDGDRFAEEAKPSHMKSATLALNFASWRLFGLCVEPQPEPRRSLCEFSPISSIQREAVASHVHFSAAPRSAFISSPWCRPATGRS
ncbi:MAG: hypothetical protein B7Z30_12985 [Rhizobiales bacterium 12-68-15]|nr:MAG: hypothetical protein B7Z30_12985 [Rhizobiales bacterium 12-68-15]